MNLKAILDSIPYIVHHDIEILETSENEVRLLIPFRQEVRNYVGTMHAGALFTAAETAAGAVAFMVVPGGQTFALLRGVDIKYTRRAESDVVAVARIKPEDAVSARTSVEKTGRGDVIVSLILTDKEDAVVFQGNFDYALRSR